MAVIPKNVIDAQQGAAEFFDLASMFTAAFAGETGVGLIVAAILEIIADVIRIAAEIEQAINFIANFFTGRPPTDATIQSANTLYTSQIPEVRLLAGELLRNAAQNGLNLADTEAVAQLFDPVFHFVTQALNIDRVPALAVQLRDVVFLGGDIHEFDTALQLSGRFIPRPPDPIEFMRRGLGYDYPGHAWLAARAFDRGGTVYVPGEGTFPPPLLPPGQPGQPCPPCPPGGTDCTQYIDQIQNLQLQLQAQRAQLVNLQQTIKQLNQQLQNCEQGGGQPPDPDGDQVAECCTNIVNAIDSVALALNTQTQPQQADCCAQIIAAIGQVVQVLGRIAAITPIVNVTVPPASVANSVLVNVPPAPPPTVNVEPSRTDVDLTPIVEQLKFLVREGDIKQPILDYLEQQGFLDPQLSQLVSGADWGDTIFGHFRTWAWTALQWLWKTVGVGWDGKKLTLDKVTFIIARDVESAIDFSLDAGSVPLYPLLKGAIDALKNALRPTRFPTVGDAGVDPDLLLSKTLAPVLIVNAVALVADYLGWDLSEQLREYVDLAAELLGLAELKDVVIGTLFRAGPVRAAELNAKATYLLEPPALGELRLLLARGLIPESRFRNLLRFTGLAQEFNDVTVASSFEGLNPRMLLQLIQTGLFTDADLEDEMQWSGIRATSRHRLLLAAPYLATKSERDQLRTALQSAFVAGLLTDQDLANHVDAIEHNVDRGALVLQRSQLEQQIAFAKTLEAGYSREFQSGLVDVGTYQSKLEGLGLTQGKVQNLIAEGQSQLNATLHRQMEAAEKKLIRETTAIERRSALKNFQDGIIDGPQLATALALTGLTLEQTAAWVDLAVVQRAGNVRWLYGLQLTPADATILKQRVTALTDQRKSELLSDLEFENALKALKIPSRWVNALRAAADATLTPKTARVLLPVSTSA